MANLGFRDRRVNVLKIGTLPLQDASHYHDYYISTCKSQPKLSFATVTGKGEHPN